MIDLSTRFSETFAEVVSAILQNEPRPARDHRPDLPASVDALLLRTLSKEPETRPGSATELARELRRALERPSGEVEPTRRVQILGTDRVTESGVPLLLDLPTEPEMLVKTAVRTWDAEALPPQPVEPLLRRLLDRPLHTSPLPELSRSPMSPS